MNSDPNATSPLHLAGMAVPLMDCILPSMAELEKGEQLVQGAKDVAFDSVGSTEDRRVLEKARDEGVAHIAAAKVSWQEIQKFLNEKDYHAGKKDLTAEETQQMTAWVEPILVAARDINRLAQFTNHPEARLSLRHMGGTIANKFHAIHAGMGEGVTTHILGALGDEDASGNRARAEKELQSSNIDFQSFQDLSLGNMPISYIIPTATDRIVLKAHVANLPEKIASHLGEIAGFTTRTQPEVYFIEGSDRSDKKFGDAAFNAFADQAMASGKPIAFSFPTDTKLVLGTDSEHNHYRAAMTKIISHPMTNFLTCNEEELVALLYNQEFQANRTLANPLEHPQIQTALGVLQSRLINKKEGLTSGVEPIAFISLGDQGALAVTAEHIVFSSCEKSSAMLNTLGAGDNFAAGCFMAYQNQKQQASKDGVYSFNEEALREMLHMGQALGKAAVEQKGAQLPPATVAQIVHGAPPLQGQLAAPIATPQLQRGIA